MIPTPSRVRGKENRAPPHGEARPCSFKRKETVYVKLNFAGPIARLSERIFPFLISKIILNPG